MTNDHIAMTKKYLANHWSLVLVHWFLFCCCVSVIAADPTPAQKLIQSPRVLVIAHRGNSSVAPENTLPAFQSALDAKADLVELDYYHSADGVPVVMHDATLDRTTNSEGIFFDRQKLKPGELTVA